MKVIVTMNAGPWLAAAFLVPLGAATLYLTAGPGAGSALTMAVGMAYGRLLACVPARIPGGTPDSNHAGPARRRRRRASRARGRELRGPEK